MNCDLSNQPNRTADSQKWDPDDGICSLVQLINVGLRNKLNLLMAKSTMRMKNQQVSPSNENGTQIHKIQESEDTYADAVTNTSSIKTPNTTTTSTKNYHYTLLYTTY